MNSSDTERMRVSVYEAIALGLAAGAFKFVSEDEKLRSRYQAWMAEYAGTRNQEMLAFMAQGLNLEQSRGALMSLRDLAERMVTDPTLDAEVA